MMRILHVYWFLVTIATYLPLTDGACSKFTASTPPLDISVTHDGVCIYAFSITMQYAGAESLCNSEGTRLMNYDQESKQTEVAELLGSSYNQHWTGLNYIASQWQWWDITTGTGTSMTSARWEGGSSGEVAYTHTSNMGGFLKAVSRTTWYRPVCEDASGPEVAATTATTTTAAVAGCKRDSYVSSDSTRQIVYTQQETMLNAKYIETVASFSVTHCGAMCLRDVDCCYFRDSSKGECHLYSFSEGNDVACLPHEFCYVSL